MVLRNAVTTEHLAAIAIRSCKRHSLLTAAAISGVTPGASAERSGVGDLVGQQPVAESADRQMSDGSESVPVVAIDDQPCDLVGFIGNDCLIEKCLERQIGERVSRRDAFFAALRRHDRELIAAAQRRGFGQQRL